MKALLTFLTFFSSIFADYSVEDSVDPISGKFLEHPDFILDAIVIHRVFLDGEWKIQPQTKLTRSGNTFFTCDPFGENNSFDIRNLAITLDGPKIFLRTKEGTERVYKKKPIYESEYSLWYEHFPNNKYCFYEYDAQGRLSKIKSTDSTQMKIYAFCNFKYYGTPRKNPNFDIIASDGRTINYQYNPGSRKKRSHCQFFLSTITGAYQESIFYNECQLAARIFPNGPIKRVDFLQNGKVKCIETENGTFYFNP